MDSEHENNQVREIEDIIDIQKAKGNISNRQVFFDLPSESESTLSANLVKSLDSGLSNPKPARKAKKPYFKRQKSPIPDVVTWPSDSDITVLRMKLCLTSIEKDSVGYTTYVAPGDGLHLDSSSMVNLATLYQSQASKNSLNLEELLPLSSWEEGKAQECDLEENAGVEPPLVCALQDQPRPSRYSSSRNSSYPGTSTASKVARFFRLYFCPCCSFLYDVEMREGKPDDKQ